MMNKKTLILIFLLFHLMGNSQNDTLFVQGEIGLRGRWQTGNLDQIGINPNSRFKIYNSKLNSDVLATYQLLKVNGFTAVSDLWIGSISRLNAHKKIYPMVSANFGFAESYRINSSIVMGAGAGINMIKASPFRYFQINGYAGYLDFKFEDTKAHTAAMIGTSMQSSLPIGERMKFSWELHTYHSLSNDEFWGLNNIVILYVEVFRNIFVTLNHQTIYNNQNIESIKNTNTLMLFGFQFQFHNR